MRSTTGGGRVATFSLATSEKWTDDNGRKQERTEWHRINVWNRGNRKLADLVDKYVHKGDQLSVEGKIRYRQWTDKDGQTRYTTEIEADEVIFLTSRRDKPAASAPAPAAAAPDDDDIPF